MYQLPSFSLRWITIWQSGSYTKKSINKTHFQEELTLWEYNVTLHYYIMVTTYLRDKLKYWFYTNNALYFTSLFELTQFSGDSWRPSTIGSLISGTIVKDAGSTHANLKKTHGLEATIHLIYCNSNKVKLNERDHQLGYCLHCWTTKTSMEIIHLTPTCRLRNMWLRAWLISIVLRL